jgi:hypothetical protein
VDSIGSGVDGDGSGELGASSVDGGDDDGSSLVDGLNENI